MKRLVVINLILILLILKIPSYNTNEEINIIATEDIVVEEVKISSRSLEQSRQQIEVIEIEGIKEPVTTISQNCIDLVKKYEGLKTTAYLNKGEQYYTIGYGHHGKDVKANQTITEEQANNLLEADLKGYVDLVLKYCDYLELTQNELDALVSFTYNVGQGNLNPTVKAPCTDGQKASM